MRFLYKYMSMRPEFFETPRLRATPASELNDPFEGRFNEKQMRDADRNQRNFYREKGKQVFEVDDALLDDSKNEIQNELRNLGILSFTEDYNNPLMWAHYAQDHKGFVVEFDCSKPLFTDSLKELNGRKSRFGENHTGDIFEFPEKVDYRQMKPSFERAEHSAPESMDQFHWAKFHRAILFTKSNDWIYEKEQRSVVQLKDADSIICNDNEFIRDLCSKSNGIDLRAHENGGIQLTYPSKYEMNEDIGDTSTKDEIHRAVIFNQRSAAIHLFGINPNAISAVYLGYRANDFLVLEAIKNNSSLKHLKIFKMGISQDRYELLPSDVTSSTMMS